MTDDLDALLASLPPEIVDGGPRAAPTAEPLIEVVLDLGRRPEARFPDTEVDAARPRDRRSATSQYVVEHIGTFGDDNRAGIERTLHRISAIRNRNGKIVGLTLPDRARGATARSRSSATSSRAGSRS